jgi:hypothetical protein
LFPYDAVLPHVEPLSADEDDCVGDGVVAEKGESEVEEFWEV